MVYESDFYTTRRPYRYTPSYSTYTATTVPSRQVRVLPGLGKVHIIHSYDRIVPYVGHKRLTVVTSPPKVYSTKPSVLQREYDWIERKVRPWVAYSATNNYLNSNSAVRMVHVRSPMTGLYYPNYLPISDYTNYYRISRPLYSYDYWPYTSLNYLTSWWPRYRYYFDDDLSYRSLRMQRIFDDETRLIRAQAASLLKSVHLPVPRLRSYPISSLNRYAEYPARFSNDHYIHRLMQISPKNSKVEFVTYYTEPVKKYIGQGRLACISYIGDRGAYGRRRNVYVYEDPVKSDIQLLSFYINKFREEKQQKQAIEPAKVTLSPSRPSRRFNAGKHISDETPQEIKELREARAARLARINAEDKVSVEEDALKARKQREEAMLAEEKALAEEQAAQKAKEAEEKKAKAAREAAERAAELERQAELLRLEEIAKLAEIERARKEEEERLKAEEERRLAEEAKAEEERQQLRRLEEIARQAEEEREAELLRQAEELAELARQEAELAEQAKREAEAAEIVRQQEELEELRRQEEELAELERQEKELEEAAQKAKLEAESALHEDSPTDHDNEATDNMAEDIEEKDDVEEGIESTQEGDLDAKYEVEFENEENEAPLKEADDDGYEMETQEIEDEEPIAEAEDVPTAQGDTADEAEEEDE